MTAFILPGTLDDTSFADPAILLNDDGFPSSGLSALYLFEDGSGTAPVDSMGGAAGAITNDYSSNNAYVWLSGGGLSLSGAQIMATPARECASAWTMVTFASITANLTASGTEAVYSLLGLRAFGNATARGSALITRGGNISGHLDGTAYFNHRVANGSGGRTAGENVGGFRSVVGAYFMMAHSFDGDTIVRSAIYNAAGGLIASDDTAVTAGQLFTISGTTISTQQPTIGGLLSAFAGCTASFEALAIYDRFLGDLSPLELQYLGIAGANLVSDRGRTWA